MALIGVNEVMEIMKCKKDKAYRVIRELNKELEDRGYRTRQGMVIDKYLYKRYGLDKKEWQ